MGMDESFFSPEIPEKAAKPLILQCSLRMKLLLKS
jgi:hypothetical protein